MDYRHGVSAITRRIIEGDFGHGQGHCFTTQLRKEEPRQPVNNLSIFWRTFLT